MSGRTFALCAALALAAGCKKDEPGPLGSLTSAGLPNSFETGASRHGVGRECVHL